ncbi:hypothetical protein NMG60_11006668 [Bertholletia excelsa]
MQILVTSDTTTLSYWLNWRVLVCAIWVLTPMFISSYIIWKYEYSDHSEAKREKSRHDEAWKPCVQGVHPIWLLAFRVIAFSLLLGVLVADIVVHGVGLLLYYTQWTLILVTVYFGFGSLLSIYGCYQHSKMKTMKKELSAHYVRIDAEQGLYAPLTDRETAYKIGVEENMKPQEQNDCFPTIGFLCHVFHIIFQMSAGAVMLTDSVYWFIIFPFLTIKDLDMNCLTILTHTLNAIVLLGDTSLNCLRFPWFRISYFLFWTSIYVIFQWIIHACTSLWWPYPFLDLSGPHAPLWYLLVALLHIPCYGVFGLIVDLKHWVLPRWFPETCYNVWDKIQPPASENQKF